MSDPLSLLTGKTFAALETAGNRIVDQDGEAVFIKAINWYGMELESFGVPAGVDQRSLGDIMQSVADLGFNTLRLPVSTLAVLDPYAVAPWFGIDFDKNPELEGANSLEVLEHVIDEAAKVGLSVIIDNHNISSEGWEGHWYDADYTEAEWVEMWETLAATLSDKDNVIGADLRNEPFDAAWDDWSTAAETAGNAIHAVDEDWLVIVEGVHHSADGDWYQWGGNLKDVHIDPVVLNVDNKVVYSVHEYPYPVEVKLELTPGSTYYSLFDEYWGSVSLELNAPVFIGEFGFKNDSADDGWTEALTNYIQGDTDGDGVIDEGGSPIAGFAYWNLNPPAGDGHHLLAEDFETVRQEVWVDLAPLVAFEPDWVGEVPDTSPDPDPDPDPIPDPTPENAFELALIVNSDWGNGVSVTVSVTNTSNVAVATDSIVIALDAPRDLSVWLDQIWRAALVDANPDAPTFRLIAQGDGMLDPGEVADFLFVASYDGTWNVTTLGATAANLSVVEADLPVPDNAAPVAADIVRDGVEDTALTIDGAAVLAVASDADGDTLQIVAVGGAQHGTVALVSGNIVYTPDADFAGSDTFTYTLDDGQGSTDTAAITVNVAGVNDAPVAQDIAVTLDEDGAMLITNAALQALGTDPDGDALTFSIGNGPALGAAMWTAEGLLYTPDADVSGTDGFTLVVSDGEFSATAAVAVTVRPVNDAPGLNGFTIALDEDTAHLVTLGDILAHASDVDSDTLTVTAAVAANGTATLGADGILYTPGADFSGADALLLTVSDGQGGTATATVTVNVAPVNDAPTAQDIAVTLDEDGTMLITNAVLEGLGTDPDGDALTFSIGNGPLRGDLAWTAGGLLYTPDADVSGADSFTLIVSDGDLTATSTVDVTVRPVNDAPQVDGFALTLDEDTAHLVTLADILAHASDADGDTLTVTAAAAANGTVTLGADDILYTPGADYSGTDAVLVTVSDGHGGTGTATVSVTVQPVNDAPVAGDLAFAAEAGGEVRIGIAALLAAGSDVDGDTLQLAAFGAGVHGALVQDGDALVYSPAADFSGTETIAYTIADGNGGTAQGAIVITVEAVPETPAPGVLSFEITQEQDWGNGAFYNVAYTNVGGTAIDYDDLTIAFDPGQAVSISSGQVWGGSEIATSGNTVTFAATPYDTDGVLSAGETKMLGFVLSYAGTWNESHLGATGDSFAALVAGGADVQRQPVAPSVGFALSRAFDWGTGAAVTLDVTNQGDAALGFDDFAVAYDGDRDVTIREEVYEAAVLSFDPDRPVFAMAPTDGSSALGAGETRSFVFLVNYDGTYGTEGLGISLDDFAAVSTDMPFV